MEWVSVKKRLPPIQKGLDFSENVLYWTHKGIFLGRYHFDKKLWFASGGCSCCEYQIQADYWMPLPEAPKD